MRRLFKIFPNTRLRAQMVKELLSILRDPAAAWWCSCRP